ncbi:ThiF family adenylyltransferase [Paraglaciecola sp.]|uniref:ThiF family adenylyltransferase n=1 Tax=Paraglaciecola sp. TaxID=1920173 RepID=UPI00273D7F98|nr:ThiF family adenylyltransferase [Paraglaciecola sp.]
MFNYTNAFSRNIGWVTDDEQQLLKSKKVAIAGAGGVGGEHLVTLARLGIGSFSISDFDEFEVHNFNRQAGAFMSTLHKPKCDVMRDIALDINPELDIETYPEGIDETNVEAFLDGVDVYVDSLDFFALNARKLVFKKCQEKGIPILTAAPLGMGCAFLCFMPGQMTFEEYFRFDDCESEDEQLIKFLVGLSPAMLQRNYLVVPEKADFEQKKGPSVPMAVKMCAGIAGTYVLKILLNRGSLVVAPKGLQFDAFTNKFKKTWRPLGNRNPLQKIMFSIAKNIVIKKIATQSNKQNAVKNELKPIEQVFELAKWAPSGDNTQVWRIEVKNDYTCIIHGFDTSDWVVYDKQGNASKLALGCLIENFELAAHGLGYEFSISQCGDEVQTPHSISEKPGAVAFKITIQQQSSNDLLSKPDPLFHYIKLRTVQRKPMGTKKLSTNEKQLLEQSLPAGFKVIWKEQFSERLSIANLLYGNAYTRLSMKEGYDVHSKIIEFKSVKDDCSAEKNMNNQFSKDKLPAKSLGVDPITVALSQWSMQSWGRMRFLTKYMGGTILPRILMDWLPAIKSSSLFAIVAEREPQNVEDYIASGRAVQRFWLQAAALNLGFQPAQTPVIFSEYLRKGVKYTDNKVTTENAQKMELKFSQIFNEVNTSKIVFMGRLGRSEAVKYRSVRLSLEELKC